MARMNEITTWSMRLARIEEALVDLRRRGHERRQAAIEAHCAPEQLEQMFVLDDELWDILWLTRTGETYVEWAARHSGSPLPAAD